MPQTQPRPNQGQDMPRRSQSARPSGASRSGGTNRRRRRRSNSEIAASTLLYVVAVIGVSLVLAVVAWLFAGDVLALNKAPHSAVVVLSPEIFTQEEVNVESTDAQGQSVQRTKTVYHADLGKVADTLKDSGIIEHKLVFRLFASMTGGGAKMSPGSYELNTDMDYRALISSMSAGSASRAEISVTIPEGYNLEQIFALLEEKGVASVSDLTETAANHDYKFDFLEGIPLGDARRLEGYLFPDTYQFYVGEDPLYAINKMLVNFTVMMPKSTREELAAEGKDLGEIITIASLIEKETDGTDQAMISSVIHNRLKNQAATNGYLQIDATLAYLNGGQVPTEADKSIDSPYNTYLYPGLPKGPIANPGSEAIWAAMNPKESNYYYYALGTDGLHHYSRTLQEHQAFLASLPKD